MTNHVYPIKPHITQYAYITAEKYEQLKRAHISNLADGKIKEVEDISTLADPDVVDTDCSTYA